VDKLTRGASGLRHLRWAREIYATLAAHVERTELNAAKKEALKQELKALDACIQHISGAVKGYRDFLERERVKDRGVSRAIEYVDPKIGGVFVSEIEKRAAAIEAARNASLSRSRSLKATLELAIGELRAHLLGMDGRIADLMNEAFVENLYPPLTKDRCRVADDEDDDDDATGRDA
jgi:hypothetical protein